MGVVVDFDPILEQEAQQSIGPLGAELAERWAHVGRPELIVLSFADADRNDGLGWAFATRLFDQLAPDAQLISLPPEGSGIPPEVQDAIASANHIGLFALGVVTGTSLHRMLATVSDVRRGLRLPSARVESFVVHARPESQRALETVQNPFGRDAFHIGFESLLPEAIAPSPLRDEQELLSDIDPTQLTPVSVRFLNERLVALRSEPSSELPIFWGPDKVDGSRRLRPGSLYGEALSELAAFVAVGSAVHRRRESTARGGIPEWRQFEMPAIVRSYFDPLIICAVLRWLRPEECWWGREVSDSARVVTEFLEGYREPVERAIVAAELLLAGAQGKVPGPAIEVAEDHASALLNQSFSDVGSLSLAVDISRNQLGNAGTSIS